VDGKPRQVDVLVIGGGVVGCAIVRELTRFDVSVVLIERQPDICEATSKANSAIIHTGFDAPVGTLEAQLLAEARELWPQVIDDLHIPYLQTGAIMVATSEEEEAALREEIVPKAEHNGVALEPFSRDEMLDSAPYLTERALSGVLVEGEGVIDPFWTTRAYCENAVRNGADVYLEHGVTAIDVSKNSVMVFTDAGRAFHTRMVVNAAGLWSDEIARLAGDDSFCLTPRKGQFIITEEDHGIAQIVLPVPSKVSKGILVTPIVFGGVLLGPTAEDIADKTDTGTTQEGLHRIREGVSRLVPAMGAASSIRQFAGLRAVSSTGEYIIRPSTAGSRLLHVCGIRSTGLSASPAIARHVAGLVRDELELSENTSFDPALPEFLGDTREGEGDVVCLCRSITRAEILSSMRSALPPTTLDGLKRRTGAMLGDCQGNICMPRLIDLFRQELGRDPLSLQKNVRGSGPLQSRAGEMARAGGAFGGSE
jgi:glycerol-3-phosphate dehydrogenase